jgi:protein TonB
MKTLFIVPIVLCAMTPLPGIPADVAAAAQTANPVADAQPRVDTSGVNMQPAYPETALRLKESGSPAIRAYVRGDGTVRKVSLERSSGYDDLDSAAANAVMHWKFLPAIQNGQPVSGEAVVLITFQAPQK